MFFSVARMRNQLTKMEMKLREKGLGLKNMPKVLSLLETFFWTLQLSSSKNRSQCLLLSHIDYSLLKTHST
jgi:hypothetical protein